MPGPEEFVARCVDCVAAGGSPEAVAALVSQALRSQAAQPASWGRRELLHRSDALLIVDLTLPAFATSAIHDHRTWAVIGVSQGCEVDYFYERRADGLALSRSHAIGAGEAVVLDADTIHSIANPSDAPVRGLHVYGCDLARTNRSMWDPETAREQPLARERFEAWEKALTARSAAAGRTVLPRSQ